MGIRGGAKVSVIVPVYNAERYIAACLDSLMKQTLRQCEIIVVDDGSTDGSRSIVEQFQLEDDRIILIRQSNQGVSAARNTGLHAASGEYIGFVDADDYVKPDMYERLYSDALAFDCDVVLSNFESELEGHPVLMKYHFPENCRLDKAFLIEAVMPHFLKSDELNTAVNKLYRAELLHRYKIKFPHRVALGEDGLFNMNVFGYAESMVYVNYTGYYYREVPGSATRNIAGKDYFRRALEVFESEPPSVYSEHISLSRITELKAVRLMSATLSYIYIYFKGANELSLFKRFGCVRRMIRHEHVRAALPIYRKEMAGSIGRYEKYMLALIEAKSTIGLMCAAAYSRFRST